MFCSPVEISLVKISDRFQIAFGGCCNDPIPANPAYHDTLVLCIPPTFPAQAEVTVLNLKYSSLFTNAISTSLSQCAALRNQSRDDQALRRDRCPSTVVQSAYFS